MKRPLSALCLAALCAGTAATAGADEINIYSSRHYDTDIALYERFTELTGTEVNLIEGGGDELIARMEAEGPNSPADILITVDAGRLWRADEAGLFQPAASAVLEARVPAHLRHPDGHWFGLSKRARIIVFNREAGLPEGLSSYEDLADPRHAGSICVRSSSNIYNLSLLSSLIAHHGEAAAEAWAAGVVANMARGPEGNDTAQIRAVAAGECDIGIVNSYYVGRLLGSGEAQDLAIGAAIDILFPNQKGRGAHVNISGVGVARHAPNPEAAIAFIEYLVSDAAQHLFAAGNNEYPVVEGLPVSGPIAAFGAFTEDTVNATLLGENQPLAVQVFDRAGWR